MSEPLKVLVGYESSGTVRRAFRALGHDAWSCDLLPADDGSEFHFQCDVFEVIDRRWDIRILHPACTFLTNSAEWAFKDPDFVRYPGVGYHQRVKPETKTGHMRRAARKKALNEVRDLMGLGGRWCIENPRGAIGTAIRPATQIIQPYEFGHDASKATCLWLNGLMPLKETKFVHPRYVCGCGHTFGHDLGKYGCPDCLGDSGAARPRWSNQTDSGQNRLSPNKDRWKERSVTYSGIAEAMAEQWGKGG